MTNAKSASFSVRIEKIDSKTKDAIANATFALYNKTDNRYIYNDVKTNANGMITFDKDIQFGKEYVVLETAVSDPDKYVLPDGGITVKATENGKVYDITSSTLKSTENVTAMRINADGKVVPLVIEQTWENTPPAPEEEYGNLKIKKDSYDHILDGFIFEVRGNGKTYKNITDSKGEATFKHLPVKDANGDLIEYEVSEVRTKAVDEKYGPVSSQTVTLEKGQELTVSFMNPEIEEESANIRVIKTSDDNHIQGIKIVLKSSVGFTATAYTDGSGYAEFNNLPVMNAQGDYITYTITEELTDDEARKYTEIAPVVIERLVSNYTTEVKLYNSSTKKEIRLIKVDGTTDKPVEGAEFSLYLDSNCKIFVKSATSKIDTKLNSLTNGKAIVSFTEKDGLMSDTTYYLKETKAPKAANGEDYTLSDVIYECRIDEYGKVTYRVYRSGDAFSAEFPVCENYTDTVIPNPAKIIKVDSTTGNPLVGAQFGLYSDERCTALIETATTAIDTDKASDTYNKAVVSFDTEVNKVYYIKEIKAPSGYTASDKVFKAIVDADGKVTYGIVGSASTSETFPVCENEKSTTDTTVPTGTTPPEETTPPTGTTVPTGTRPTGSTSRPTGTTPARTTQPTSKTSTSKTTQPPEETTTTNQRTTTGPDGSRPTTTTTATDTTKPPVVTTTPSKKPPVTTTTTTNKKTDDNPETGVGLNVAGFVTIAILSGIACAALLVKPGKKRMKDLLMDLDEAESEGDAISPDDASGSDK